MRELVILGVAAGCLWLSTEASAAPMPRSDSATSVLALASPALTPASRANHERRSAPSLDYGMPHAGDARVYSSRPDRAPTEDDYRRVSSSDDRYGTDYDAPGPHYAPPPGFGEPEYFAGDEELARACRRDGGVAGGVIGAVVGGVAGNRIAGRGNRTAGSLIGAGVGAIAGSAIDRGIDKRRCEDYFRRLDARRTAYAPPPAYPHGGYPPVYHHGAPGTVQTYVSGGHSYQGQAHGYAQGGYGHGGYGWYSPGVVVTTVIQGAPIVTETTTTSVRYETVRVAAKRHVPKKRWKPRPKPRCVC